MNGIKRPTIFMEESATNDQVAATFFTGHVNLTSTPQQRPTQPVHHHANAFCGQSSSVTRIQKPEENDEASPVFRCTNRQSVQSDAIPVQNTAGSSSTLPQANPQSDQGDRRAVQNSAGSSSTQPQANPQSDQGDRIPVQNSAASSSTLPQPHPQSDQGDRRGVQNSAGSSSTQPQANPQSDQGDRMPVQNTAGSSATHPQANLQSDQGDRIPVQNTAGSSSTHPQLSPDSRGACKATNPHSASCRHPQQETGQPPKDTHEHHGGQRVQLEFPAVSGLNIQSESLEPPFSLHSSEPLSSTMLAISVSPPKDARNRTQERIIEDVPRPAPDLPCLWDDGTLAAFDDLRDFTPEESRIAAQALGLCEVELPQNIRQFMMAFAELKVAKGKLRVLAEKLKEARMDVVDAMRCQTSLLPHLGPRMPEKYCIKDMTHSWRLPFTTALSTEHPTGHDWKWLAEYLAVPQTFIKNWEQRERNPAEVVLSYWQGKILEATVGNLFSLMLRMGRGDLAAML